MKRFTPFILLLFVTRSLYSQEIPIETWRAHISYNSIHDVVFGNNNVIAAGQNGVMVFDQSDRSVSSYNKVNGLSGSTITSIAVNTAGNQLVIAYADGMLDIVEDNVVTNFDRLKNSTTISGSKRLNAIRVRDGLAYIAADYGVVVFDLARIEVKETWRDLGANGATLKINEITFHDDSIFLATAKGVLGGDLQDNLLDFNLWKRFDVNEFNASVGSIAFFGDRVYAAINGAGLFHYDNGVWTKETFLQNSDFQSLEATTANLLITEKTNLWKLNSSLVLTQVITDQIVFPLVAKEDENGDLWIGDNSNGLVSDMPGDFETLIVNGPSVSTTFRLKFANERLYALQGGPSSTGQPLRNPGRVNMFSNGTWDNVTEDILDVTDVDASPETQFLSSFGYGLEKQSSSGVVLYDETNSPLVNINPPGRFVNITAVQRSGHGLWVANHGASQSLHLLKGDGSWESFSFPITASRYPVDIAIDTYGYVWIVLNPAQGGGILVFDYEENRYAYLVNVAGQGGLPNKSVRSIAVDRDGYVWVGTDEGVAYFLYPPEVFEPGADAIKPIFESRFLLKDDRVTSIAIDGGNRKWMGTERGVWLFSPTGEQVVYNFTMANSPLLADVIRAVEIVPATGEVFFATEAGVISFRAGATSSESAFQSVKIFPNPITKEFSGIVGISGLATDAIVKITDISGKLVWQTQANGGTATWNVQDYNGRRATTGIYLVFAATSDGGERVVGKLAVVD